MKWLCKSGIFIMLTTSFSTERAMASCVSDTAAFVYNVFKPEYLVPNAPTVICSDNSLQIADHRYEAVTTTAASESLYLSKVIAFGNSLSSELFRQNSAFDHANISILSCYKYDDLRILIECKSSISRFRSIIKETSTLIPPVPDVGIRPPVTYFGLSYRVYRQAAGREVPQE